MRSVFASCFGCALTALSLFVSCAPPVDNGNTRLTILHGVSTNNLPLFVAVSNGYFLDEGIALDMKPEISSPRNLQLLHLGEAHVAGVGAIPALLGLSRGVRVVAVAENGAYSADAPQQAVIVRKNSGIDGLSDLAGKTLAITGFGSHGDITLRMEILPAAGLTVGDINLVEIPVAQMEGALATGTVDAALVIEPWASQSRENDELEVLSWLEETIPATGHIISMLLMQEEFANANPDIVEGFRRAYERGVVEAKRDHEAALALSAEFLKLPPELLAKTPAWEWPGNGQIRVEILKRLAGSMKDLGVIDAVPDVDAFVWPSSAVH
jgi:NitT/TauT family transport system substrate-binding protein